MPDMPRPLLPHLHREITRHGKAVWYVRVRKGPRVRLTEPYGSEAFMAEYQAALAGKPAPERPRSGRKAHRGTLAWLVERWRESSAWATAAPATKLQRESILRGVLATAGDKPYTAITEKVIRAGRERRQATPFAANNFLKCMRALFGWAKESQLIDENPAAGVAPIRTKTDGYPPWSMADVERFRARWPLGTRERLAMELLLWTGLRRGDVVRLGRQHVREGLAVIRTEKTNVELFIPLMPQLLRAIEAGPTGDLAYLSTQYGRPMVKEAFGNWFGGACRAAGVQASAHGLRKLAATVLAEAGCSEHELQAALGWISNRQSQIYTRTADRRRLAIEASRKRMQNEKTPAPMGKVRAPGLKD